MVKEQIKALWADMSAAAGRLKRRTKAALLRLERRRRQPVAAPAPTPDTSRHTCRHCGYGFEGRLCPQCGMPAAWTRFTWTRLLHGFLDIWGMGNRPMFRSMGHLLWRPGYMVRDYLNGHYLSYFPPFKMLAVLVVFLALTMWLLGIEPEAPERVAETLAADSEIPQSLRAVVSAGASVWDAVAANTLYRLLVQIALLVVAVWLVFRKRGLNLVETFFAMVYFSCQMQLVTIAWLLLTRDFIETTAFPYALPELLVFLLLVYDFRQLYGLRPWGAVWRTLLVPPLLFVLYVAAVFAVVFLLIAGATIWNWIT